jgi:hemin uptake protein HemP
MQSSTIILRILEGKRAKVHSTELLRSVRDYVAKRKLTASFTDQLILHEIDLLVEDGHIIRTHNGAWYEFQISNKGYAKLKAWYEPKKLLSIMSNDFAKMLSIIATILSIFATYLSIKSRY